MRVFRRHEHNVSTDFFCLFSQLRFGDSHGRSIEGSLTDRQIAAANQGQRTPVEVVCSIYLKFARNRLIVGPLPGILKPHVELRIRIDA